MPVRNLPATVTATALAALLAAAPARSQGTCELKNGVRFPAAYAVDFWKENPAGTVLPDSDASDRAPGYRKTSAKTFVAPGSNIPQKDADLVSRKLAVALDTLMAQPSLSDVHGVSVIPTINMRRGPSGLIEANLSVMVYPIKLDHPGTLQRDGGYFTPGEGVHIDVLFNTPIRDANPGLLGTCYGSAIRRNSNAFAAYVVPTGRSIGVDVTSPVTGKVAQQVNPALLDPKRPATELQFLDVQLKAGNGPSEMARGLALPTDGVSRIYAAVFMTDWNAVAEKMGQTK